MIDDVNQEAWLAVFEYLRLQKKSLPAAGTSEELQQKYKHVLPLVSQYKRFARIREYRRMNQQKRSQKQTCSLDELGDVAYTMREFDVIDESVSFKERFEQYDQTTRDAIHYFICLWCRHQEGEEINKADRQRLVRMRRETGLPLKLERKNYKERRKNSRI